MKIISGTDMAALIKQLVASYNELSETIHFDFAYQLNRSVIIETIDKLRQLMFPGYFGKKNIATNFIEYHTGELIEEICYDLGGQIEKALQHWSGGTAAPDAHHTTGELVLMFLSKLCDVRKLLATDVDATFDGDPAAFSKDEIISSYPGIYAIMVYRLAHEIYKLNIPLIPRIMTEHAHSVTGIDIHPGAAIGHHFFIDHGTGIVIGETTVIGNHVKIYQGVTLGALSTRDGQTLKSVKRHPTIENNVTVYSGASILGGTTVIGEGVVIGSNAFITESVPENTRVSARNPGLHIKANDSCANCPRTRRQKPDKEDF
ncbi:MAG: serine acetyltransferase [Spirochaetaceae bacterium]|jgi:serine O-acetyltransferase|nr:serine acetyltransferase [Spirochaetaceae bacterium]